MKTTAEQRADIRRRFNFKEIKGLLDDVEWLEDVRTTIVKENEELMGNQCLVDGGIEADPNELDTGANQCAVEAQIEKLKARLDAHDSDDRALMKARIEDIAINDMLTAANVDAAVEAGEDKMRVLTTTERVDYLIAEVRGLRAQDVLKDLRE